MWLLSVVITEQLREPRSIWTIKESISRQRASSPAATPSLCSEPHLIPKDLLMATIRPQECDWGCKSGRSRRASDFACLPWFNLQSSVLVSWSPPLSAFLFHYDFPGLNVCAFNYVDPCEFLFQCTRSNISSCDFLLHNLSFSLLSLWGAVSQLSLVFPAPISIRFHLYISLRTHAPLAYFTPAYMIIILSFLHQTWIDTPSYS